ncbi:histone H1-like repetitive region-containing protein [Parvularcula lutaonensis]|uniref:Histone H1-like repetitive region-containing protein n=1 Tax=Parvularcula lutaonensis TaxID=491923 RepID=A0ABV7MBA7_9PROT
MRRDRHAGDRALAIRRVVARRVVARRVVARRVVARRVVARRVVARRVVARRVVARRVVARRVVARRVVARRVVARRVVARRVVARRVVARRVVARRVVARRVVARRVVARRVVARRVVARRVVARRVVARRVVARRVVARRVVARRVVARRVVARRVVARRVVAFGRRIRLGIIVNRISAGNGRISAWNRARRAAAADRNTATDAAADRTGRACVAACSGGAIRRIGRAVPARRPTETSRHKRRSRFSQIETTRGVSGRLGIGEGLHDPVEHVRIKVCVALGVAGRVAVFADIVAFALAVLMRAISREPLLLETLGQRRLGTGPNVSEGRFLRLRRSAGDEAPHQDCARIEIETVTREGRDRRALRCHQGHERKGAGPADDGVPQSPCPTRADKQGVLAARILISRGQRGRSSTASLTPCFARAVPGSSPGSDDDTKSRR